MSYTPLTPKKNSVKPVSNWEKEILNTEFLPRLYELIFFWMSSIWIRTLFFSLYEEKILNRM